MPRIPLDDIDDPHLAPYRALNRQNLTRHSGLFIAEGDKVTERLIASRYPVESLLAEPVWAERLEPRLPAETPIYVAPRKLLEATIGFNFHRGVLACARRLPGPRIAEVIADPASRNATEGVPYSAPRSTILICPDVQDPTNLGSLIRTAAAFGCTAAVLGQHCADPFSRRVLRVSMGAVFHLPLVESRELAADIGLLRHAEFEIVATVIDPDALPLAEFHRGPRLALLLGSEGHGLGPEWLALADRGVTIPMHLGIDSLNVAVAAAVFLFHCSQ